MTVKQLIAELYTCPSDAIVTYSASQFIVKEVLYDEDTNSVYFAGSEEFDSDYYENI